MKRTLSGILFIFLIYTQICSQIINKEPLSPRITGYNIEATLDPSEKTVTGNMEAFWVNTSTGSVPDVQLHMYMNAFRSDKSTFSRESRHTHWMGNSYDGYIDITSCTDRQGNELLSRLQYISPDDGNPDDSTVLRIDLPEPAMPGDTVFLKIKFVTGLPSEIIRTGYSGDFFFVAQWFPKFGVYEPAGMRYRKESGWNCHQFHANSEFYSNHSVYDVRITVPFNYVVGSGGMLIEEPESGTDENTKTLYYRAEDIVDFAWTAWPGYKAFNDQWNHVSITLLIPEERTAQVERQFKAVKNALEFFTENVGPFPWPHLTFADPPLKGAGAGGMEYTTLFTSGSSDIIPEWFHLPESVTVHEFGHAYFMGIMATNEFEEPWMDEGMNSFFEARIMDKYWGENSGYINHPHLKLADKTISRLTYVRSGYRQVASNDLFSWNYPQRTYGMMSYNKAATWLYTLMGIVGEETTNDIFREYYRLWGFRHPSSGDFINVVNEVVARDHGNKFGNNMNWFFDQTLYGTGVCDYKVAEISNRKYEDSDSLYSSTVGLQRTGEVMLPLEISVRFSDGDEITEAWDGKGRYMELTYTGYRKVKRVIIDPEYRIRMDVNFVNNSMTVKPDTVPLRSFTNKLLVLIQLFISIFTL
ncbi:MAG TPA: M1 family metallopeptidase [Bacteroidales bacterium]|nr:M1 family metallopeptidase [Bacteroidales bacterium]